MPAVPAKLAKAAKAEPPLSSWAAFNRGCMLVEKAGFRRMKTSSVSEATYYQLPGRYGLLRLARHTNGQRNHGMKYGPTVSCVTFSEEDENGFSEIRVENMIAYGAGLYLLRATFGERHAKKE